MAKIFENAGGTFKAQWIEHFLPFIRFSVGEFFDTRDAVGRTFGQFLEILVEERYTLLTPKNFFCSVQCARRYLLQDGTRGHRQYMDTFYGVKITHDSVRLCVVSSLRCGSDIENFSPERKLCASADVVDTCISPLHKLGSERVDLDVLSHTEGAFEGTHIIEGRNGGEQCTQGENERAWRGCIALCECAQRLYPVREHVCVR